MSSTPETTLPAYEEEGNSSIVKLVKCGISGLNKLQPVVLLAARLFIANVFFKSGLTKIKSWETTLALFEDEYAVPLLPYEISAYLATAGELILPVLLVFGLFSRVGAIGLFMMTLVIELFVYPDTTEHYYWLLLLGVLATHGAGKLSLDWLIWGRKEA